MVFLPTRSHLLVAPGQLEVVACFFAGHLDCKRLQLTDELFVLDRKWV